MDWQDDPVKNHVVTLARAVLTDHDMSKNGCCLCGHNVFVPMGAGVFACISCNAHNEIPSRHESVMAEAILDILGVPWKDEPLDDGEE